MSFHFHGDGPGQDTLVLYGRVFVDENHPPLKDWPPYLDKYGPSVRAAFGDVARFSDPYPIALRVTITRVRGSYTRA